MFGCLTEEIAERCKLVRFGRVRLVVERPILTVRYLINGFLKTWQFHELLVGICEIGDVENKKYFKHVFSTVLLTANLSLIFGFGGFARCAR